MNKWIPPFFRRKSLVKRRLAFPYISERFLPYILKLRKWLRRSAIALAAVAVLMAGLYLYLRSQALPVSKISQTSQMLDIQGHTIDTFHAGENRRSVSLTDINHYVVDATLAIEDRRFYDHAGFDLKGMARAVVVNVQSMSTKQGASTLTQQLARNLYLSHERTWQRKLKEAMYTAQLEMNYSKDDILGMYLNQIYYGHGSYGIEAAAMMYFDKHASELSLAESAMLAGIPKGPKYYSPYLNMKNAKDRQYIILEAMKEGGSITEDQAQAAYAEILKFQPLGAMQQEGFAPYFRDYIRYLAVEQIGIDSSLLNEGGITIYTTLDQEAQAAAEESIKQIMPSGSEQQAALIAIDPRTGYIKAMVGGRDYAKNQYNRVFASTRQPGSAFKPFLYLSALQSGFMSPVTRFKSEPTVFSYDEGRKTYEPHNYGDKYAEDYIDMRTAISGSDNIYAVNTIMTVGADKVIETARKLGVRSRMQTVPSLALGTFPVSPFEMASAYGVFANAGLRVDPVAILRIVDRKGNVLYEAKPKEEQVITAAEAYVMTSLLESVFDDGGTAHRVAATIKRPIAGKTGTTATDAWLVGYTPELAAAVWVGYDKDRKLTVAEAHRAAPIFARFIEGTLSAVPPKYFRVPEGVVNVLIDPASGKLAAATCPNRRLESFLAGTEPTEVCGSPVDAGNGGEHGEGQGGTRNGKMQKPRSWWNDLKRWWTD
ncbi:PBP1A family penicillin-binding protein [Paenibacillus sp. 1011MAR3C5]|uniref:transglycosylase domain-containing protein n=1 Tax=Paenibacillus sp. 1011MAR3C5 TaxID=1675787 RepID=UPI000E6CCEA8|nr:PBP1A family penicillin-binding protein [Paenibacillus sp. 1011MAR3C5]RJE86015.1 PBP1A family penicillin-binding protein [Paenibacillus sp. 1011MAR3C5]